MPRPRTSDEDLAFQFALLTTPAGVAGSGRVRYAAAMYFYQRGLLSSAALEVYRTCSVFDHEDPLPVLDARGLAGEIKRLQQPPPPRP